MTFLGESTSSVEEKPIEEKKGSHVNDRGLHWLLAVVFVIGDMAGGGVLGLPKALVYMSLWPGLAVIFSCGAIAFYTALELSYNWRVMQKRWATYREECRQPYQEMAFRAVGPWAKTFVGASICLSQFGFATVLVLLAAKNVSILLHYFFSIDINMCYLIVIVGAAVWPVTMLKSPMHFWQIALFSAGTSSAFILFIIVGMSHDATACHKVVYYDDFNLNKFFSGYGAIVFAFGGHSAFPTIQHDMRKPAHFSKSVVVAFCTIFVYYLSVSLMGYFIYGSSVGDAVIPSIQISWVQQTVNVLVALHVLSTIVIVFSPLVQHFEEVLHVPLKFGIKRFFIRSALFWFVIFIALSLPDFGPLMDLIGATTMSLLTMLVPPILHVSLRASTEKLRLKIESNEMKPGDEDDVRVTFKEAFQLIPKTFVINAIFFTFGLIGSGLATYSSIVEIVDTSMPPPCYVQIFTTGLPFTSADAGLVNCCGEFRNITVNPQSDTYCSAHKI